MWPYKYVTIQVCDDTSMWRYKHCVVTIQACDDTAEHVLQRYKHVLRLYKHVLWRYKLHDLYMAALSARDNTSMACACCLQWLSACDDTSMPCAWLDWAAACHDTSTMSCPSSGRADTTTCLGQITSVGWHSPALTESTVSTAELQDDVPATHYSCKWNCVGRESIWQVLQHVFACQWWGEQTSASAMDMAWRHSPACSLFLKLKPLFRLAF